MHVSIGHKTDKVTRGTRYRLYLRMSLTPGNWHLRIWLLTGSSSGHELDTILVRRLLASSNSSVPRRVLTSSKVQFSTQSSTALPALVARHSDVNLSDRCVDVLLRAGTGDRFQRLCSSTPEPPNMFLRQAHLISKKEIDIKNAVSAPFQSMLACLLPLFINSHPKNVQQCKDQAP